MREGRGNWRRKGLCIKFILPLQTFWKIIIIIKSSGNSNEGRGSSFSYHVLNTNYMTGNFTYLRSVNSHMIKCMS